jgi:hypothetical protein
MQTQKGSPVSRPAAEGLAAGAFAPSSAPELLDASRPGIAARVQRGLSAEGLVFLEGIESEGDALALSRELGEIFPHRDSEPSGLTRIQCRMAVAGQPGFKGFSADRLFPHTDQSCLQEPAQFLVQVCKEQAGTGGDSVLVDGRGVYRDLARSFPELLGYLGSPRSAVFSDGCNVHCGAIFEALEDGSLGVRFRHDSCIFFSAQITPHIGYFLQLIERHTRRFALDPGQAYVINNRWWLHGREAFLGEREMWRILLRAKESSAPGAAVGFTLAESQRRVA